MKTTKEHDERIAKMTFAAIYPLYVEKVEKKGRTVKELRQVIAWLTGFKAKGRKMKNILRTLWSGQLRIPMR